MTPKERVYATLRGTPRDRIAGWSAVLSGLGMVVLLSLAVAAVGWALAVVVRLLVA